MSIYKQNQDQYNFLVLKLKEYLRRELNNGKTIEQFSLEELFYLFKSVFTKKQSDLIQIYCNNQQNTILMQLSQYRCHIEQLEANQRSVISQRERLNQIIIKKESELNCIEKRIQQIKLPILQNQQFDELVEGIAMCKEKCDYLEEENQDFKKLLSHEKKKNCELKQHYQIIRDKFDQNIVTLQNLEQYGLEVNQRMLKQLKIINDLRQFIKKESSETFQLITPRKKVCNDGFICAFSSLENTQFLEDSFNNFDSLKVSAKASTKLAKTENELIESLSTVISLKNSLASINSKEISGSAKSFDPEKKSNSSGSEQILVSSNLRFKTHQNLGESQIRKRQISNQMDNNRAFSELDEVEEDQDSDRKALLITEGMYIEEECIEQSQNQVSPRQPWYYKSALQQQFSNKTEQRNWEYGSERKRYKSKPSVASFNSQSSCLKGCTMTLKEDFLQTQHSQYVVEDDEEAKEKDTDVNNSYEIPQLIQQEQIISDQTILINRKHQVFNNQECKQQISPIFKAIGVTVIGVAVGWGFKKLFQKYS